MNGVQNGEFFDDDRACASGKTLYEKSPLVYRENGGGVSCYLVAFKEEMYMQCILEGRQLASFVTMVTKRIQN